MKIPLWFALGIITAVTANATTVRPPTFDEAVGQSELIFRGKVTSVQSGWTGVGTARHLTTAVTFKIERVLVGQVGPDIVLEFLGGESGRQRIEIEGMPQFSVGDRAVCFVEHRENHFCPLVRLGHGRYRVVTDPATHQEHILRDDRQPLREAAAINTPLGGKGIAGQAFDGVTLTEFENQITSRAQALATLPFR